MNVLTTLATTNPNQFLDLWEEQYKKLSDPSEQYFFLYLKARTLLIMHQNQPAEEIVQKLMDESITRHDRYNAIRCNLLMAIRHRNDQQYDKEKAYLDIAYSNARIIRDNGLIIEALVLLGDNQKSQNNYQAALDNYQRAEKLIAPNDLATLSSIKLAVGGLYFQTNRFSQAIIELSTALEAASAIDHRDSQLLIITNLSTIYNRINRMEDAESILIRGLDLAAGLGFELRRLRLMFNLAETLMRQDKHSEAITEFTNCITLANDIGYQDLRFQFNACNNLAGCFRYTGALEEAMRYLDKAINIARSLSNKEMIKDTELNLANVLLEQKRFPEAKKILDSCQRYFSRHKLYNPLGISMMNLAQYWELQGNPAKAIITLKTLCYMYQEYIGSVVSEKTQEYEQKIDQLTTNMQQVKKNYEQMCQTFQQSIQTNFIGRSSAHKHVLEAALLAAQHPNANVLISGESGTGKEVIANLIHLNSIRAASPIISVNLAAITGTLIASEFFGHKKGAFTNAISDHKGYFQQAEGGSLYLDEIGEMPIELQATLLRALESRRVTPVGSATEFPYDCRIISSTNKDIPDLINSNKFRLDLYYRLNTIEIHIPALRSRPEDIDELLDYYCEIFARQSNRKIPVLESSFRLGFRSYSFPGNVRELKNLLERLFIMNPSERWDDSTLDLLPLVVKSNYSEKKILEQRLRETEIDSIVSALIQTNGKQKEAARILKISESTLTRRIRQFKIEHYTKKGG